MPELSQAWLALIGAVLGGSGLKFIEHWLSRPKIKDDTATAFRNELRTEMNTLRTELKMAETELDTWKIKYYTLLEQSAKVRADRDSALLKIQDAAEKALFSEHTNKEKAEIAEARKIAAQTLRESDPDS